MEQSAYRVRRRLDWRSRTRSGGQAALSGNASRGRLGAETRPNLRTDPQLDGRRRVTPGATDNSVYINAPFELVWRLTNDVRSWPDLFTEYASVEVQQDSGETIRFRLTTVPDPDGQVWSWVSERTSDLSTKS